jgi:adenosylcobinamide-GDP ribazoletransferase
MRDAWRLAVGTLTAVPVRAPGHVDHRTAGLAMVLAPLAVLPLAAAVALVVWGGDRGGLAPLAVAVLAVAVLALGTRVLHLDGLADTADGLTASYDRERSLSVMRSGTSGPAGVVAVVLVLLAQVAGVATLVGDDRGWLVAGVLVCASRTPLVVVCARGVPGARSDGLGAAFVGSVPRPAAAAVVAVATVGCGLAAGWAGLAGAAAAAVVVALLLARVVRRLGGVTGDVFGATIELTLATLLLAATTWPTA